MTQQHASTVFIHNDLRALFRARRRGHQTGASNVAVLDRPPERVGDQGVDVVRPAPAPTPATDEPARFSLGPSVRHRLRCDGRRPFVFDGAMLLERAVDTPVGAGDAQIRQVFSLYMSTEGTIYARLALIVPEGVSATPLSKVASLGSAEAFREFTERYDPAEGWSWMACKKGTLDPSHSDLLRALRAASRKLVATALDAQPIQTQPS